MIPYGQDERLLWIRRIHAFTSAVRWGACRHCHVPPLPRPKTQCMACQRSSLQWLLTPKLAFTSACRWAAPMYGMPTLLPHATSTVRFHRSPSQCLLGSKLRHLLLRWAAQVQGMAGQPPQCLS